MSAQPLGIRESAKRLTQKHTATLSIVHQVGSPQRPPETDLLVQLGCEIQIKLDDSIIFRFTKGRSHRRRSAPSPVLALFREHKKVRHQDLRECSTFERNGTTERELRDRPRENRVSYHV